MTTPSITNTWETTLSPFWRLRTFNLGPCASLASALSLEPWPQPQNTVFSFLGGVWSQGLMLVRLAFYHLSHAQSSFAGIFVTYLNHYTCPTSISCSGPSTLICCRGITFPGVWLTCLLIWRRQEHVVEDGARRAPNISEHSDSSRWAPKSNPRSQTESRLWATAL
jgi:hypothetical protein